MVLKEHVIHLLHICPSQLTCRLVARIRIATSWRNTVYFILLLAAIVFAELHETEAIGEVLGTRLEWKRTYLLRQKVVPICWFY